MKSETQAVATVKVNIEWSHAARHQATQLATESSATEAPATESASIEPLSIARFSVRETNNVARRAIRRAVQTAPPRAQTTSSTRSVENLEVADKTTVEVALLFVSDEEMRALNLQFRGKNKPTDVLSWAQSEGEAFPQFADFAEENILGDIAIALETAHRQARERHHSLQREIEFLCVHGALHLLGYDHQTSGERRAMWKWQEEIVARLAV